MLFERGRLVGIGSGPACYGDGKRYWAEEWAASHQIKMDDAVAYADNWSDRSLLERVGRAVVVHPRGRLLRLAKARGWDIVRPRRPTRSRLHRRARDRAAVAGMTRESTAPRERSARVRFDGLSSRKVFGGQ